ncbi:glycoside hydrolase TIM-barrel-like domain-containing protein [Candidatus Mesenet endosymbiont of Agriotes lineatus]|uniref:glycoside hydrolase/phage tail family protein n=1 Tax=Candidatus Mesenet endosymbiont of Agriotes lineatus TaxID=3077948 RepID=UPI0030CD0D78
MSTVILSAIGSSVGSSLMEMIGQFIGAELGAALSSKIDSALFGLDNTKYGPRLKNLNIQTSTYGKMIPIIYGTVRVAGNMIWAQPIKEVSSEDAKIASILGIGKTGSYVSYSYFATLAIGICEGEIEDVTKIWANDKLLTADEINFKLYKGTEDQEPDPLIEATEGSTPAYRGLAYIVIEDFPLADYGNRVPNFTFEVTSLPKVNNSSVAARIKNVNLIPGSGEFVYDTKIQMKIAQEDVGDKSMTHGPAQRVNHHNYSSETDFMLSLKQLRMTLPNVEWVSVVVNWFASSLDIKDCKIYPAVEFQYDSVTIPDDWQVGETTRSKAKLVSKDSQGNLRYGGTISDVALLRCVEELHSRGYKVMLYPMLLMDTPTKPWRGYLTGLSEDVSSFFVEYNKLISHYLTLFQDQIDGFIIGSEFIGLTKIKDNSGDYPAAIEFVKLAEQVKQKLGRNTIVTYAADWTEYHSSDGWYNMDELWSSRYIDVIGIDAYFPLTDGRQPTFSYTKHDIERGWTRGEGYDYFYLDSKNRAGKTDYTDSRFALKNIEEWWSKHHINPDGKTTKWQPKMKKIWFTEYGFPSVDGCSNQPNAFIDQSSIDSKYPYYSKGNVDFYAQRTAIDGTLAKWHNSEMVEKMFLWAWDARPYPYFPDLCKVWADCGNWQTGHWIQGKISLLGIDTVIADILQRSGIDQFDVSMLRGFLHGYVINHKQPLRSIIQVLQNAYFFDIIQQNHKLLFLHIGREADTFITMGDIVPDVRYSGQNLISIERISDLELNSKVNVMYISRIFDYQVNVKYAQLPNSGGFNNATAVEIPLILEENQAQNIAEVMLYNLQQERNIYNFTLPIRYLWLSPSDIIKITNDKEEHVLRITKIKMGSLSLQIEGVSYSSSIYQFSFPAVKGETTNVNLPKYLSDTYLKILYLPYDKDHIKLVVGGAEDNWRGAVIFMSENNGQNYRAIANTNQPSIYGFVINHLDEGQAGALDEKNKIEIVLSHGAVLNEANLALVDDEIIEFYNAELISKNRYRLSKLLRGKFGTEKYIKSHQKGERFVLLNELIVSIKISPSMIGRACLYKAVTYGASVDNAKALEFKLPDKI